MSRKKRKKQAPMPLSGAGIVRFFQDESEGVKIGPFIVTFLAILLISFVILAWLGAFTVFGI
ncbi:MAG: preprotein translocase subunit Sec61beta [Candidatus Asgardarchaeia archaeon]